jgi:hypothetical protein
MRADQAGRTAHLLGVADGVLNHLCSDYRYARCYSSWDLTNLAGYSIAISGLMTFRLTGGSPNTPNGQRLVRFAQSVVVSGGFA